MRDDSSQGLPIRTPSSPAAVSEARSARRGRDGRARPPLERHRGAVTDVELERHENCVAASTTRPFPTDRSRISPQAPSATSTDPRRCTTGGCESVARVPLPAFPIAPTATPLRHGPDISAESGMDHVGPLVRCAVGTRERGARPGRHSRNTPKAGNGPRQLGAGRDPIPDGGEPPGVDQLVEGTWPAAWSSTMSITAHEDGVSSGPGARQRCPSLPYMRCRGPHSDQPGGDSRAPCACARPFWLATSLRLLACAGHGLEHGIFPAPLDAHGAPLTPP